MKILLLGAPGSGKGSQAVLMKDYYDIPHISTGDALRANIAQCTALGLEAKAYMEKGLLVPDSLVDSIVKARLYEQDCSKGFILDGYPRNLSQAKTLDAYKKLDVVLMLDVAYDIIVNRISSRRMCTCGASYNVNNLLNPNICERCGKELFIREDDKAETVQKRLKVYAENTAPLLDYYSKQGIVIEVDGQGTIADTFNRVKKALENVDSKE